VIEARHYCTGTASAVIEPEAISDLHPADLQPAKGELVWVDLADPAPAELRMVAEEFSLHPLALEGALEPGERSKHDRFPTHDFVVLYDASRAKIALFLAPGWVISVRTTDAEGRLADLAVVSRRFEESPRHTVGWFSYHLLDEIVDGYETQVDGLEDMVEDLEDRIMAANGLTRGGFEQQVLDTRRELLRLRRIATPVRDVVQELRRSPNESLNDPDVDIALADVHDHVLRVLEQLDAQRELLGNAFEAHLSLQANQMNLVMKQLTSWGSIVFGATLIAGIYGMNFSHMPELSWYFGYPLALGMMAALSLVLYRVFRKRDWL